MNAKTIIYIGGELPDKSAAAHRILANGKALRDYGFNVVFISDSKDMPAGNTPKNEHVEGFQTWFLPYPSSKNEWIIKSFTIKNYERILNKYQDIKTIIVYNPSAFSFIALKHYCLSRGISLVSDCTEWHTTSHLSGVKRLVKYIDINLSLRYAQKKADGMIVISSFLQKHFRKLPTIRVLPLVDLKSDKWKKIPKENTNSPKRFVYAGNMGNEKDRLDNIISVLSGFCDYEFHFDIIGITKSAFIEKYPSQTFTLEKLEKKILFHGKLSNVKVLAMLKNADFSFIIRDRIRKNNAGFPTKFGESIACGTPVIASDFGDIRSIIEEYNIGIMVGGLSNYNIHVGIQTALEMDDDSIKRMKMNCLSCSLFDYRNYIDQLGDFINDL